MIILETLITIALIVFFIMAIAFIYCAITIEKWINEERGSDKNGDQ